MAATEDEPNNVPDVLAPAEAARYLGVSVTTINDYAARGFIKPIPKRAGDSKPPAGETPELWRRKRLFRRADLDAFLEGCIQKARVEVTAPPVPDPEVATSTSKARKRQAEIEETFFGASAAPVSRPRPGRPRGSKSKTQRNLPRKKIDRDWYKKTTAKRDAREEAAKVRAAARPGTARDPDPEASTPASKEVIPRDWWKKPLLGKE